MVILQSQKMDTRKIKVARIKTKLILKPDGFETEVRCLFVRFVCKTRYSDSLRARKRYRSLYKFNRLICDFYITTTVYWPIFQTLTLNHSVHCDDYFELIVTLLVEIKKSVTRISVTYIIFLSCHRCVAMRAQQQGKLKGSPICIAQHSKSQMSDWSSRSFSDYSADSRRVSDFLTTTIFNDYRKTLCSHRVCPMYSRKTFQYRSSY